jgi:hypothetical protein
MKGSEKMKNKEKYLDHIKERWSFARKTVLETLELKNHLADQIAVTIFDKTVSPYHYFVEDNGTTDDKPTKKQIAYAKKLKIKDPEFYTKKDLSNKIDEVANSG